MSLRQNMMTFQNFKYLCATTITLAIFLCIVKTINKNSLVKQTMHTDTSTTTNLPKNPSVTSAKIAATFKNFDTKIPHSFSIDEHTGNSELILELSNDINNALVMWCDQDMNFSFGMKNIEEKIKNIFNIAITNQLENKITMDAKFTASASPVGYQKESTDVIGKLILMVHERVQDNIQYKLIYSVPQARI